MRKFMINVNGTSYNVEVEELGGFAAPVAGGTQVKCPMPGTILDVKVSVGDTVNEGDVLMILEAMKMENEILAPSAGKLAAVQVSKGASVNSGDVLAVLA